MARFELSSIQWAHAEMEMGTIELGAPSDMARIVFDCLAWLEHGYPFFTSLEW